MIEEIWKDILGYEGFYQVSSFGRVRSLDRYDSRNYFRKGRILKLSADRKGYLRVGLHSNGKEKFYSVHRLVAEAFIHNPDNLPEVNHIDEDKTNNRVENLEFCDSKYNNNYGTRKDRIRNTKLKKGYWSGLSKEEYKKKRYQEHKDKISERQKKYYQENKDKLKEYRKEYSKKYYQKNKEKILMKVKEYSQKNRDRISERNKENYRKKKEMIQNNV